MFERVNHNSISIWLLAGVLVVASARAQEPQLAPAGGSDPEGVETLTQGPIHEAFANPTDLDPTPGPVVTRQPPPDIQEEPPEFMPEESIWIGGYWVWDEEREDFVWVTGVARKTPPGMRYLPGYWNEADGGWQRVSGFWTSAETTELTYRQPPPNSLEAGPSSPAPADNYFWVPGNWTYYETGYRWRGGYWTPYQQDWVWVPARWVWTPGGFVYLPGFWDFQLAFRGQFFAPIYFQRPVYLQPTFVYRPWCVIPTSNLFIHLWIRPSHCHYYFGNYYGPQYASIGFQSWCHAPTRRHYDPFFTYCSVHYRRQGVDYVGRVQGWHDHYEHHEHDRPQRTWREQVAYRDQPKSQLQTQLVARNIKDVAERDDAPVRLTKVDQETRKAVVERSEKLREINVARKQVEREGAQVVARLPRASDGAAPNRGAKSAKGTPEVVAAPANVNLPKLKLPKEAAATSVVKSGESAKSKGKGPPKTGDKTAATGSSNVNRGDSIPPPMPNDTNPAGKAQGSRGKGREKVATDGPGDTKPAESAGKSRGTPPVRLPPGDGPERKPVDGPMAEKGAKGPPRDAGEKGKAKAPKPDVTPSDAGEKGKAKAPMTEVTPSDAGEKGKAKAPKPDVTPSDAGEKGKAKAPKPDVTPDDQAPRGKPQTKSPSREEKEKATGDSDKPMPRLEVPRLDVPRENLTPSPNIISRENTATREKAAPREALGSPGKTKEATKARGTAGAGAPARPPKASDDRSRSSRDKERDKEDKAKERP